MWIDHINSYQRAMFKFWCLRRNLRHPTPETKLKEKHTNVSLLEYADIFCDPHTLTNINKLERIQKALRIVCIKYRRLDSVSSPYSLADIEPLPTRRKTD